MQKKLQFFKPENFSKKSPLYSSSVQAGFPSPADDYMEKNLNLHEYLVRHPAATFFVKVEGNSMNEANIYKDDILIVDRSLSPSNKMIVIAVLNGEFTVKRLLIKNDSIYLMPENSQFKPIKIEKETDFQIWGVVTYIIHKAR